MSMHTAVKAGRGRRTSSRGVALVTTLLILLLLSGITLGMVLAASSDELINGYYRNLRGSFYAADSGLNVARQAMLNQLAAAVPATITNPNAQPIPAGTESAVQAAILSTYGSNVSLNSGEAAESWPGQFRISSASLSLVNCTVLGGGGTCGAPTGTPTGYQYNYAYSLASVGQARANEQTTLTDSGNLLVNVNIGAASGVTTSFAAWGFFIDEWTICDGSYLVPGTVTGPVFTNGAWTFGTSGSYIFTDTVGSVSPNFGYQFSGSQCYQSSSGSYSRGRTTIAPTFQSGYQLGQNPVDLPENDYNQKRAVLDGVGTGGSDPSNAEMNAVLRRADGTPYPSSGASTGVFLPFTTTATAGCPTPPCMTGGGILVEGNAQVTLAASGASTQIVTIRQGSTTTTITMDLAADTTVIQQGSTTTVVSGVPTQYDPVTGAPLRDATMIYVDGTITSLKGPGGNQPAIQDGAALTVTAYNDIVVTDDITYKTPPVTTTQNQIPGTPAGTLIPGNDHGQVLGLFTARGDIRLENCSGCGNLEIDASLATISEGGTGGLVNTGNSINTLTIIGGRIQNHIKNINATTRNVLFDRRFSQNGFAPPWFPSTTVTPSGVFSSTVVPSVQRVQWLNQTSF